MRNFIVFSVVLSVFYGCTDIGDTDSQVSPSDAVSPSHAYQKKKTTALKLPIPEPYEFTSEKALSFIELSLECVDKEYPNKPSNVLNGDDSVKPPRDLHPAFFGCFDWHSAVHGHWSMVRILKLFPGIKKAKEIHAALNSHLTEEKIAAELAYFNEKHHKLYERPYGWGWLVRLAAELGTLSHTDAEKWSANIDPLVKHIRDLSMKYFDTLSVPLRAGTHHNTAYAMIHMLDYANAVKDIAFAKKLKSTAIKFYLNDKDCPTAYEPSGEDFISACLTEADLMHRVLAKDEFSNWLTFFLPPANSQKFIPLRKPVVVKDRHDPRIGHLIGLSLQRASAYKGISKALDKSDNRKEIFSRLSGIHQKDGLIQMMDSGYGGAHWLASFAIYLLGNSGSY